MRLFPIFLVLISVFVFSGQSQATPLTDPANKHNLSSTSTNAVRATSDTRICVFCHTPHGATPQSPLWNRKDPTTASFPLYSSGTLNIDDPGIVPLSQYDNADPSTYPNGASRMCLSCHDGVSAIGEVISLGSPLAMTFATLNAYGSGTIDLSSSHPISFVYDAAVRDAINAAEGGTNYQLPTNPKVDVDGLNRLQCTTCHDPHNDTRSGAYDLPFWANYSGAGNDAVDYDNTCQECHLGADWGGSWGGGLPLPAPIH